LNKYIEVPGQKQMNEPIYVWFDR